MATRHQNGSTGRTQNGRPEFNKDELKSDSSKEMGESGRGNQDQFGSRHDVDNRTREAGPIGQDVSKREAAQDTRKPTGKVRTGPGQQHKPRGR
jgi:hypothetical protein